jgi:hypothetical protein
MMKPVVLEVLAPMLAAMEMNCRGCNLIFDTLGLRQNYRGSAVQEYPEDWKQAVEYLTSWIQEITYIYRHRIRIRVIDAQTPLGLWKQLRHRLFRFPAFIVDNQLTYIGWDPRQLEVLIDKRIHAFA